MKRFNRILSLVIALAMIVPGFAFATDAEEDVVNRIYGPDRYKTAIAASQEAYKDGAADTVILATGRDYADALAGSALAGAEEAPVLLTNDIELKDGVLDEIKRLEAEKVIILGGSNAITRKVDGELEDAGLEVKRVAGSNRFETAAMIAEEVDSDAKEAFLVTGREFADALAIGPVAARDKTPVLLSEVDSLPKFTEDALEGMDKVTLIGGTNAISDDVKAKLEEMDIEVERITGSNRYATAANIADKYFDQPEEILVATGLEYMDAMVGGYLGAIKNAPVILVEDASRADAAMDYLEENEGAKATILGGNSAVSDELAKEVEEALEEKEEELTVESVSAIDDMKIAKDKDVELKFLVNGEEEVTKAEFDEKYGEEGYTVEFKYTFSGATEDERAGKVNKKNDFRYAVQVKDAEDNLIPEKLVAADYKKVEVVEAGTAVEVTELGLEDWDLDYVTTTDEDVKIEVVKAIDALGVEVKDAQLPEIKKVVSDDIRIAYYNGDGIVPVKAGEVTFTVEFDNEDVEDVEYTVEVKAGQKASSIDIEEPVKVKANDDASTVKFDVLDQYEEMLRADAALNVKVGEADAEDVTVTKGVATLQDLNLEKGTHKVVVKADNKEIGTFDIQAVDVVKGEIDEYKLVFDTEKTSLDINPLKLTDGKADTLEINVEAYIDGVEVELDETELEAKSSDEDVATVKLEEGTITVTAEAEGTTTVSLYTKEGDLVTKVDEIDVEVKNTTSQIDTLKSVREDGRIVVADDAKTGDISDFDYGQLKTEDVELEDGKTLDAVISEVRYVEYNHQVVVTVKDEFGGKSFVFDAITEKVAAARGADNYIADLEDDYVAALDGVDLTDKDAVQKAVNEANLEHAIIDATYTGNVLTVKVNEDINVDYLEIDTNYVGEDKIQFNIEGPMTEEDFKEVILEYFKDADDSVKQAIEKALKNAEVKVEDNVFTIDFDGLLRAIESVFDVTEFNITVHGDGIQYGSMGEAGRNVSAYKTVTVQE